MRKLPVTSALNHAFRSTRDNFEFAFHVSWPWMVILVPLNVGANLYLILNGLGDPEHVEPRALAVMLPVFAASIVAYASIAVNWHRYVLLDEVALGWQRLRIDALMWRYIGNGFLIGVILIAGAFAAGLGIALIAMIFGAVFGKAAVIMVAPAILALYAGVLVAAYRLSVKLPAIALGRSDFSLKDAWSATEDNFWQLLGLIVLFIICVLTVAFGMFLISYAFGTLGAVGLSVALAIQVLINWAATILGVTLLTSLYGFFVEGRNF